MNTIVIINKSALLSLMGNRDMKISNRKDKYITKYLELNLNLLENRLITRILSFKTQNSFSGYFKVYHAF